ncbi:MAG: hypothetical protein AB7R69_03790 [Candidatus Babeliales bacterium]
MKKLLMVMFFSLPVGTSWGMETEKPKTQTNFTQRTKKNTSTSTSQKAITPRHLAQLAEFEVAKENALMTERNKLTNMHNRIYNHSMHGMDDGIAKFFSQMPPVIVFEGYNRAFNSDYQLKKSLEHNNITAKAQKDVLSALDGRKSSYIEQENGQGVEAPELAGLRKLVEEECSNEFKKKSMLGTLDAIDEIIHSTKFYAQQNPQQMKEKLAAFNYMLQVDLPVLEKSKEKATFIDDLENTVKKLYALVTKAPTSFEKFTNEVENGKALPLAVIGTAVGVGTLCVGKMIYDAVTTSVEVAIAATEG